MHYKLRKICQRKKEVVGLTVPESIKTMFSGCYFSVERIGTTIVYSSGTHHIPTNKEVEQYGYEKAV